jgi:peroxiredoxin
LEKQSCIVTLALAAGKTTEKPHLHCLKGRSLGVNLCRRPSRSRQPRLALYFWVLLPALLLVSCVSKGDLELGEIAPSFEVQTLVGEPFRFDPSMKRVHVIYFWAAWCRYCEDDFQLLNKLYGQWEKNTDGPRLLAINAGQPEERIRKFIEKMKPSFPIYIDEDIKVSHRFGVRGLPTYFITDKRGIIRHIILGWADEKTLLDEIDKVD